ncbi:putative E3 ubiquitin-protein ligase [Coemansia sp. Benny D115]|nr:putative E3 ubiquitin-protein ligase [Coemansia sp. Benny D115]
MVVSQFFSPLRTLKNKARGKLSPSFRSDDEEDDDDDRSHTRSATTAPNADMSTGTCMCCGSKVTFPSTVACFKCTVCDTINDLRPQRRTERHVGEDGRVVTRPRVPPPPLTLERLKAGVQTYKRHPEKQALLEAMIRESFANWDVLNFSFVDDSAEEEDPELAIADVQKAYKIILSLPPVFIRAMMSGIEQILRRPGRPLEQFADIRYLLIILENPLLSQQTFPQESSYHHHIVKSILGILANLPNQTHYAFVLWLSAHPRSACLSRKTHLVNQFITYRVQKYDRARRRNREQRPLPLTSYSSQSNQRELPAFQRTRSATNSTMPPGPGNHGGSSLGGGEATHGRTTTRHNRMRSNTDSRISMSSHEKAAILKEMAEMNDHHQPDPTNTSSSGCADGLGISMLSLSDRNRDATQSAVRFVSLGASTIPSQVHAAVTGTTTGRPPLPRMPQHSSLSSSSSRRLQPLHAAPQVPPEAAAAENTRPGAAGPGLGPANSAMLRAQRSCTTGTWAYPPMMLNDLTPPPAAHARSSPRTPATSTADDAAADALMRQSYYVPIRSHPEPHALRQNSTSGVNTTTNTNANSNANANANANETGGGGARLRAASMSAGDLTALASDLAVTPDGNTRAQHPADRELPLGESVRPTQDAVLGVLSGTVEPESPVPSRTSNVGSGNRSSLTRTRSSSEAPPRRHARMRHHDLSGAAAESASRAAPSEWGMGIDLDEYYVGADGVFYPKTSSLVMHQHDWRLVTAAKVMALLHAANLLLPARARLGPEAFYNAGVDNMDLIADYDAWQARVSGAFSFCQYPFLLSLKAKIQIMQVDAARQMDSKLKEAVISALFQTYQRGASGANQPNLKLLIRRHCLVEDSLHQLATHEQDLKKRLKIEFVGEEGIDAGGLTKEWFMLLVRQLMNPMYGMFVCETDQEESWSPLYWFNPASLETSNQYFLVGVVVGLALYNSTILDLRLPLAVFKKLLRPSFYQTTVASTASPVAVSLVAGTPTRHPPASSNGTGGADGSVGSGGGHQRYGDRGAAGALLRYGPASGNGTRIGAGGSSGISSSGGGGGSSGGGAGGVAAGVGGAEGRSPIYGLLSLSAQLRYQINEMLADVSQFRPQLARGLRQLLQYREDDVEEVFGLSFEATYDAYGEIISVPLIPQGSQVPVTSHNRVEYVMRYLQWILNDSVSRQFEPFKRGFYYVCGGNALSLFKPEEIELMVHGSGDDWSADELRKITEYVGFGETGGEHELVRWMWEVLSEMSAVDRKLFLAFVTGADRMPMGGCGPGLRMKLALLGDDRNRLPIAHTCFNQLGIWEYQSKDELRDKLMMAIKESEGFGLK